MSAEGFPGGSNEGEAGQGPDPAAMPPAEGEGFQPDADQFPGEADVQQTPDVVDNVPDTESAGITEAVRAAQKAAEAATQAAQVTAQVGQLLLGATGLNNPEGGPRRREPGRDPGTLRDEQEAQERERQEQRREEIRDLYAELSPSALELLSNPSLMPQNLGEENLETLPYRGQALREVQFNSLTKGKPAEDVAAARKVLDAMSEVEVERWQMFQSPRAFLDAMALSNGEALDPSPETGLELGQPVHVLEKGGSTSSAWVFMGLDERGRAVLKRGDRGEETDTKHISLDEDDPDEWVGELLRPGEPKHRVMDRDKAKEEALEMLRVAPVPKNRKEWKKIEDNKGKTAYFKHAEAYQKGKARKIL